MDAAFQLADAQGRKKAITIYWHGIPPYRDHKGIVCSPSAESLVGYFRPCWRYDEGFSYCWFTYSRLTRSSSDGTFDKYSTILYYIGISLHCI